jgi:hypothetical protein
MAKILFSLIILIHGLIHLSGFFKAFDVGNITQLSTHISKPVGVIWFVVGILFLITVLVYFMNYSSWPFLAIMAVVVSQVLIITVWSDAKFGTIANLIILIGALPALGSVLFNNMITADQEHLLEQVSQPADRILYEEDFQHLPEIVQAWLLNSGVAGKPEISFVRLKQTGKMKTGPGGNWMDFTAVQYFDVKNPSFVWKADVRMMPLITLTGRDKLQDGQGEMLIKLLSLVNVVNEKHNDQINTGTLIRFLGEICWFPSAALSETITWEEINEHSAKATLTIGDIQVSGIFRFDENGDLRSFEADRYYGSGPEAVKHRWIVEAVEYKTFDGYRVPVKSTVTWKLPEGDFTWLHLEITDLEVNKLELYP